MDTIKLEEKWQKRWADAKLGEVEVNDKPKFFMIFAYPGISGFLHVGHMRGFSYTDAICRYKRMTGHNVLFPVGTHASGNQAIAFANKVKNKDEKWLKYLRDNGCPEKTIKKMTDKGTVIDYFNQVYIEDYWKKFGFLCDWRRFTSTADPDYEKFIQWQFKKLRDANLLVQKPYFATFCPDDGPIAVDPSETDISKGGKAEKNEYVLLKFKYEDKFLVAATLRPETVYGQTNLWINPNAEYVEVKVENETWVMSKQAAEKLTHQKDGIIIENDISAKDLLGKTATAPAVNREVPILPANFVNADVGSGLVTCVPSDAPYDYIALKTLQDNKELCDNHNINHEMVKAIKLIPIIKTKGYQDFPAQEICQKMKITSLDQKDKLDEATKEIYKAGFHGGEMMKICEDFAGKKVSIAKELVKQSLLESNQADSFHDLSEEVICRCGKRVIIKRIDDQWFIKYSDDEVTKKSKDHVPNMQIYPDQFKRNLPGILDWFMDRACVRLGNWIGSKLPFDDKWTIEPIADSTLYPIYYLISKYVKDKSLNLEDLREEFFDFVFQGKGSAKEVAEICNIEEGLVNKIRKDVEYFYPLDINLGGKEHQTVHFPVFLMNHVAILEEKFWPKGIFINYWVTGSGSKISKSKGGAEPIPGAIEKYTVDGMRLYYAHVGSAHSDVVWDPDAASRYRQTVERVMKISHDLLYLPDEQHPHIDAWLTSKMNQHVHDISKAWEVLDLRAAATSTYYSIYEDLRWYTRRGGKNKDLIKHTLETWAKLMCPVTPHHAEELFEKLDHKELVSKANWPDTDESKVSLAAQAQEQMIENTVNDTKTVQKLAKLDKLKKVTIIVSPEWKYPFYSELKKQMNHTRNVGEILKQLMQDENIKKQGKSVTKIVGACLKDPSKLPALVTDQNSELEALQSAIKFVEEEVGASVEIVLAQDSKLPKAQSATPGKPAIVVE